MKPMIIDVREFGEFASGHAEDAINIPVMRFMHDVPGELKDIDKEAPIILYCNNGSRASLAERWLREYGFTNVTNGVNQEAVEAAQ